MLNEADAEFFSVYTRQPGTGAQCECDFNAEAQALEFARALAARTGIPIYWNLCGRELQTDGMEADCEYRRSGGFSTLIHRLNPITALLKFFTAAWSYIEDVTDDDPERTSKFLALRAQVRSVFWCSATLL